MASIPDSNGNLQTCYRNNGGDLRVIDTATQTCANNETALNLTRTINDASTAVFKIRNGVLETATMRNVLDYEWYDGNTSGAPPTPGYCLKLSFDPNFPMGAIRGIDEGTDDQLDAMCGTDFNAFVDTGPYPTDPGTSLSVFFSE